MEKFLKRLFILLLIALVVVLGFKAFSKKDSTVETSSNVEESVENKVEDEKQPVPQDTNIKMAVIGDIMCHNTQYNDAYNSNTKTYDFSYVFENIKDYISSADIAVGNLETTFAGPSVQYSSYPTFNTPEAMATNLKDLGLDVLSTANNHCMDKGYKGLVSTLSYLDEVGISHMGTYSSREDQNTILIKDVNGIKIAFLSFTYGTNGIAIPNGKEYSVNLIDEDLILNQLSLAKEQNPDLICVNMHWGVEYATKQNKTQESLADLLFKNGADVILGSHPHVLQPMEKKTITLDDGSTKDCFVIYSLGNFISGQVKENTRNSVILNLDFTKNGSTGKVSITSASYIPIYMYKAPSGTQRYSVLDIEKSISNYENGSDKSIGSSTYSTLKTELKKINAILGENIVF